MENERCSATVDGISRGGFCLFGGDTGVTLTRAVKEGRVFNLLLKIGSKPSPALASWGSALK